MKRKQKSPILIVALLLIVYSNFGQTNTMYYMGTVPQSYYLNPATQPGCNFYLGLPAFSSFNLALTNTAISASDLMYYDAEIDSVITPFHPNANINDFLGKLDDVEQLSVDFSTNLASLGFRSGTMYFSFDATVRGYEGISFPKSLVEFLIAGNEQNQTFDFSALNFEIVNYMEFAFNISKTFGSKFSIGVRPKLLFGLGAFVTQDNNITLETSSDEWVMNAQSKARIAVTGVTLPVDENGLIDPNGDIEFNEEIFTPSGYKKAFSKNRGLGIDFGAHFRPINEIELSLSVLDLGYIKWAEDPQSAIINGTYTFQGVDLNTPDSIGKFDPIMDSLKAGLSITGSDEVFTTNLHPKLIAGGRIFLTPGFDVGLLSRTEFFPEKVNQDFIVLADLHPFKAFSMSASYSILGKGKSTFGLGLGFKSGPFNFYVISDNLPTQYDKSKDPIVDEQIDNFRVKIPVNIPVDMYSYNVRFGFNLVFGCKKTKRLMQDKPLFSTTNWL